MRGDLNDVVLQWAYVAAPIGILILIAVVVLITWLVVRAF